MVLLEAAGVALNMFEQQTRQRQVFSTVVESILDKSS